MKERPILFSGPMVRAILEGRKTMTRRVVKFSKADCKLWEIKGACDAYDVQPHNDGLTWSFLVAGDMGFLSMNCPYGKIGDRLWVRETFCMRDGDGCFYRATEPNINTATINGWRPSIFMPKVFSRITLEVTGVRVERLSEITEEDAEKEGVERTWQEGGPFWKNYLYPKNGDHMSAYKSRVASYETLWDSINGMGMWKANPWVWVVEFKRVVWVV